MNKLKSIWQKIWSKIKLFAQKSPLIKAAFLWIVLLFAIAIVTDKLIMPIFAGEFAATGEVPNVEGMSENVADSILAKAGFKYEWINEGRYSAQVPEGMVLVQMPVAGRIAKLGRTVKLTKSMGLREVEIPDLRGKSQKQAAISLMRAGLVQGKIVKGAHQSIPRGVVIRTMPMAGKKARIGDTVKVVISAGETTGKVLLPDFSGVMLDDVYAKLEKLGFKVGSIKRKKDAENRPSGTIIETMPKYGDYLPSDTKIDFVIVD